MKMKVFKSKQTYENDLESVKAALQSTIENSATHKINNREACGKNVCRLDCIKAIEKLGLRVDLPYHRHSISNNNESKITRRLQLSEGYETDAHIGTIQYNYGTKNNEVFITLYDKNDQIVLKTNKGDVYYADEITKFN